ncbi:MAG: proliferating cell nuclear antigen (pcna) [Nanoarchaeota archaeon]|nr:proliferating cell nuclear antigen (pcna) [Nanoarchaeota archaeon]
MIVKIDKPKILSDAINIISEIVNEVRIKLGEDGMSIVAVDPANVAMILFKLPKESFSQYQTGNEVWGVNLSDLKMIMKRASSGASVVFEQEDNKLKISIFDKVKRIFNMSLIEIESEEKNEPNLNFACKVEMDSTIFSQAIEDCATVADSCTFISGKEFFIIEGSGSLNSARAEFSGDEAVFNGIGRSKYSLEYLMKFIKASKIAKRVTINFSSDYPLRLDFAGDEMGMGFVLAPRVEND